MQSSARLLANALLVAAAVTAAWGRWYPNESPVHSLSLMSLIAGVGLYWVRKRSTLPLLILACALIQLTSAWLNQGPILLSLGLPLSGLVLLVEDLLQPRHMRRVCFYLVALGFVLAAHGVVSFVLFRMLGGSLEARPVVTDPSLRMWVYPYYSGINTGWRLCGMFMNDNLFGLWCASLIPIVLHTMDQSNRAWQKVFCVVTLALLVACTCWSYSRTVVVALVLVLALETRRHPKAVMAIAAASLLLAIPYWTFMEQMRFFHPFDPKFYPYDRIISWSMAWTTLRSASLFGTGPTTAGLRDAQFAKLIIETGWAGLVAYLGLLGYLLRGDGRVNAFRCAALVILTGCFTADLLESPQMAATLWFFAACVMVMREMPAADAMDCAPQHRQSGSRA